MSLETQISLLTVPQEFSRLCTAILVAEHGDQFLAIDDDRADGGNDGYLKSERRIFAMHCFKRAQNQSIEADIRRKMIGDFGKARVLKQEGIWEVDAWTFISNYAVPEPIAKRLVELGREAGIEVSWRGADYLADGLRRHPSVRESFPALEMIEVATRLDAISDDLRDLSAPQAETFNGVPSTPEEQRRLIASKPPAWEYLLFAGVLKQGKEALEFKWHDHRLRIARGLTVTLSRAEASDFLAQAFGSVGGVMDPLMRPLEPQAQLVAFGAPGEPGDAGAIEHMAKRTIIAYEAMMDWAAELRAVEPPSPFERMFELAIEYVDDPISQIRGFVDDVVAKMSRVPELLAEDGMATPERPSKPLVIEAELVLAINADTLAAMEKETKRVKRRLRWTS